jgi:predicted RNA-binding protein associated with RNAse of E/G family
VSDDETPFWYVNLQAPLRRTPLGFDTVDHALDVIVELDGSWAWKDEDELAEAVEQGLFTVEEAERFHADGERAIARILDREPPFDRDWSSWRPDPDWPMPTLQTGWNLV